MKKIIVSQRSEYFKNISEYRDTLDQNFAKLLISINALTYPIPSNLHVKKELKNIYNLELVFNWLKYISPDGIILSGGEDLGKNENRDLTEKMLIKFSIKNKLPLLGICRGMQLLSVQYGCKLIKSKNHAGVRHKIYGKINRNVNSFHNYCINRCPKDFSILAKSSDGSIEAIKHKFLPWEAWMWHPEREEKFNHNDIKRITKLFNLKN